MTFKTLLGLQYIFWGIVVGVLLMGYGIHLFINIQQLEAAGEKVVLYKFYKLIYLLGGKYAILATFELVGIMTLATAISKIRII